MDVIDACDNNDTTAITKIICNCNDDERKKKLKLVFYHIRNSSSIEILETTYDLCNKFDIAFMSLNHFIKCACENENISYLNWWIQKWLNNQISLDYDDSPIDISSRMGSIQVLNWWLLQYETYDIVLKYSKHSLDFHNDVSNVVEVLQWWINLHKIYGFAFNHQYAFNKAVLHGNLEAAELLIKSGYELIITQKLLADIFDIDVLEWIKNNGFDMHFDDLICRSLFENDMLDVMEWWIKNNETTKICILIIAESLAWGNMCLVELFEKYSLLDKKLLRNHSFTLYYHAATYDSVSGLEWLWNNEIYICDYNPTNNDFLDNCYKDDIIMNKISKVPILDWWYQHIPIKYDHNAVDHASISKNIPVLNWWLDRYLYDGIELLYSEAAIDKAACIDVLDWWSNVRNKHGIVLKYTKQAMDPITKSMESDHKVLHIKWWIREADEYGLLEYPDQDFLERIVYSYSPEHIRIKLIEVIIRHGSSFQLPLFTPSSRDSILSVVTQKRFYETQLIRFLRDYQF